MLKLQLGKCLKCDAEIIRDKRLTSLWSQKGYTLADGNIMLVGLCSNCSLNPNEYREASELISPNNPIIGVAERDGKPLVDTLADVLKEAQGGRCFYCNNPINGNYAISGGHIAHERC